MPVLSPMPTRAAAGNTQHVCRASQCRASAGLARPVARRTTTAAVQRPIAEEIMSFPGEDSPGTGKRRAPSASQPRDADSEPPYAVHDLRSTVDLYDDFARLSEPLDPDATEMAVGAEPAGVALSRDPSMRRPKRTPDAHEGGLGRNLGSHVPSAYRRSYRGA